MHPFFHLCQKRGVKLTAPRRVIADVLTNSHDHPDVHQIYDRAKKLDPTLSLATVYRALNTFEEAQVIQKQDFGDGRARYEFRHGHHHHIVDIDSGEVIEFQSPAIEMLKATIAHEYGYELVECRLELHCRKQKGRVEAIRR